MNSAVDQKRFAPPSQKEANYLPAGGATNHACSNCRWFIRDSWGEWPDTCHLIDNWPEPIVPNGVCDRHEVVEPESTLGAPVPVVIVDMEDVEEMSLRQMGKAVTDTVMRTISKMLKRDSPPFEVFKGADGKKYWLARHTGKFQDRHKEILADRAHDEYVTRVEKGAVEPPELWTLHTKGTSHGKAFAVWKAGGFTLAMGGFDETPEADQAFEFYQQNRGNITLSHGFYYLPEMKVDGVYYAYNTFEISTLLNGEEAFPFTSFEEIETMALSEFARERILKVGGEGMLQRAEAASQKAEVDTKGLEGQGVAYKGYSDFQGSAVPAVDLPVLKDLATRLETAENAVKGIDALTTALEGLKALPAQIATLTDQVKALTDERKTLLDSNTTLTDSLNAALEKVNTIEKTATEQAALKPPASQSSDTLLNDRDKSLIDQVIQQAKADALPSLVDQMSGQTTISQS